jgi:hypothetical protein
MEIGFLRDGSYYDSLSRRFVWVRILLLIFSFFVCYEFMSTNVTR